MAEEDEERRLWTVTQAAAELGVKRDVLDRLIKQEKISVAVPGRKGRFHPKLLSEIALKRYWKLEEHHRVLKSRAKNNKNRLFQPISWATSETMPTKAAVAFLGVNHCTLTFHAQRGALITYREPGNKKNCYYELDQLRELATRLAEKKEPSAAKPVKRTRRRRDRKPLQNTTTIEVGDLHSWEENMHDFLPYYTPRQAAYTLHISLQSLCRLRRKGRLSAVKMDNLRGFGQRMYYYNCQEVLDLADDDDYNFRRARSGIGMHAALRKVGLEKNGEAPQRLAK